MKKVMGLMGIVGMLVVGVVGCGGISNNQAADVWKANEIDPTSAPAAEPAPVRISTKKQEYLVADGMLIILKRVEVTESGATATVEYRNTTKQTLRRDETFRFWYGKNLHFTNLAKVQSVDPGESKEITQELKIPRVIKVQTDQVGNVKVQFADRVWFPVTFK